MNSGWWIFEEHILKRWWIFNQNRLDLQKGHAIKKVKHLKAGEAR